MYNYLISYLKELLKLTLAEYILGQSIQEMTEKNLWKTNFNKKNSIDTLFFYKHTGKLRWSSIHLRFSQFEPEIMLDSMLNFKTYFMAWYCVWHERCNGPF